MWLSNPAFFRMRVRRQWFRDRKNCAISKASVLVERFLTQPDWMMCVRATPASVVDLNFKPPSWLGWMKSFDAVRNWSLLLMTFSINLPNVLSRTIGLNDLGESYDCLLGLGMTTIIDLLKWDGQNPRSIQALAMLMILLKYPTSLRMVLRWLHDNLYLYHPAVLCFFQHTSNYLFSYILINNEFFQFLWVVEPKQMVKEQAG